MLLVDFRREYKFLEKEIQVAINECLNSGWYILGENVKKFEESFASYIGAKYCIGVGNGLEALQISLMAAGIGPGDEVITVSNTAAATVLAITNVGATPVFVDIDDYYLIDVEKIEAKITPKTKAIIPVHIFGQMAKIDTLVEISKKHNLILVEDSCQAHGAEFKGQKAGSFGDFGCFSFYPTKNLGAYGDGGAIVTNSKEFYEKCQMLRSYGEKKKYYHEIKGINSRLDELQAAILQVKLKHLPSFLDMRNKAAATYMGELAGVEEVTLPVIKQDFRHVFHLFVIRAKNRDKLLAYLNDKGIMCLIHYPLPLHQQKCFEEFNDVRLENTEKLAQEIISLPLHPLITEEEIKEVVEHIKNFYKYEK